MDEGHDLGYCLDVGFRLLRGRQLFPQFLRRLENGAQHRDSVPVLHHRHELGPGVDGVRDVDIEAAMVALPLADDGGKDLVCGACRAVAAGLDRATQSGAVQAEPMRAARRIVERGAGGHGNPRPRNSQGRDARRAVLPNMTLLSSHDSGKSATGFSRGHSQLAPSRPTGTREALAAAARRRLPLPLPARRREDRHRHSGASPRVP